MNRLRETIKGVPRAGLILVVVALIVRVALIAATHDYLPAYDAVDYDRHARSIAAGDGYPGPLILLNQDSPSAFRPPLYPYALAAAYKLAPGTLTAGRLLGALLGSIAVLLTFLVADRLFGAAAARAGGALAAVFPPLVALSGALTVESLFIPLELGVVLAVLHYSRSGREIRWALVAGILCGLAALTRANGFLLALPLVIGLVAARGRTGVRSSLAATCGGPTRSGRGGHAVDRPQRRGLPRRFRPGQHHLGLRSGRHLQRCRSPRRERQGRVAPSLRCPQGPTALPAGRLRRARARPRTEEQRSRIHPRPSRIWAGGSAPEQLQADEPEGLCQGHGVLLRCDGP